MIKGGAGVAVSGGVSGHVWVSVDYAPGINKPMLYCRWSGGGGRRGLI